MEMFKREADKEKFYAEGARCRRCAIQLEPEGTLVEVKPGIWYEEGCETCGRCKYERNCAIAQALIEEAMEDARAIREAEEEDRELFQGEGNGYFN